MLQKHETHTRQREIEIEREGCVRGKIVYFDKMANLFEENVQLWMGIWIYSNLKQWNKDIVKNVLK